jgi:hypothetical protein
MKVTAVELESEDMENIVCTAFEGGINYWCDTAEGAHPKNDDAYCPEGWAYNLYVTDECADDETKPATLDAESLQKGITICLTKYPWHVNLDGDFDAENADAIIQCAVFGDIIYG